MMKIVLLVLFLVVSVLTLTCSYNGNNCPSAEVCSAHCKQLGRKGGACQWSDVEKRCICYCYTTKISFVTNTTRTTNKHDHATNKHAHVTIDNSDLLEKKIANITVKCNMCKTHILNNRDCLKCVSAEDCPTLYSNHICKSRQLLTTADECICYFNSMKYSCGSILNETMCCSGGWQVCPNYYNVIGPCQNYKCH